MKIFRNTALILLAVVILNVIASSIIEMNAMNTGTHNLRVAMYVAGQYALDSFQISRFSGSDDTLGTSYNISDTHNRNEYLRYLNSIEQQGIVQGFMNGDSDFHAIINFLRDEINSYNPANPDGGVIAPFSFDWTFLEQRRLQTEFERCLREIIQANYNPSDETQKSLAFSGTNVLRIKSVKAEITEGPTLVNLTEGLNPNSPLYVTYLKLFGSTRSSAMEMINRTYDFDAMYNYIITYKVKFTVEWEHHTVTPFFNVGGLGRSVAPQYVNEKNQIKIDMEPMVLTKQYAIIN